MDGKPNVRKTLKECATEYIEGKKHTLSPSTMRGYASIVRNIPKRLADRPIGEITTWDIQTYIDSLTADGKAPKTVKNYNSFLSAVFGAFCPDAVKSPTLPQNRPYEPYNPSDEDVRRILDYAKGTVYEIPLRLATYGLRRSEICALTLADLDGCTLTINKALVEDGEHNWIVKTTKTESSTRRIIIDEDLAELIRSIGTIFDGYPNRIYWFLQKAQKQLGIPRFRLHQMRHYYATTMHSIGVSDADIMKSGGWKTDNVMKSVYRHEKNAETAQQAYIDYLKNHGQI